MKNKLLKTIFINLIYSSFTAMLNFKKIEMIYAKQVEQKLKNVKLMILIQRFENFASI